jgi:hypothetical protein
MITPRREEQQRFAHRIPALGVALQQQRADRFGAGRAAGLARRRRGDAAAAERLDKKRDLGRFPSPLPALDCDEFAARGQWRLPQIR